MKSIVTTSHLVFGTGFGESSPGCFWKLVLYHGVIWEPMDVKLTHMTNYDLFDHYAKSRWLIQQVYIVPDRALLMPSCTLEIDAHKDPKPYLSKYINNPPRYGTMVGHVLMLVWLFPWSNVRGLGNYGILMNTVVVGTSILSCSSFVTYFAQTHTQQVKLCIKANDMQVLYK